MAYCVECDYEFNDDEVVSFGNDVVCADCKPIYVQRLKEGGSIAVGGMDYAGFGIRFAAKFLDGIFIQIISMVVIFATFAIMGSTYDPLSEDPTAGASGFALVIVIMASYGFPIFYSVFMHGKYQQTWGKMICRIKVVEEDGEKISYLKALGRYFSEMLSLLILCIGYLMCIWSDEKKCLHDIICSTRVVKV